MKLYGDMNKQTEYDPEPDTNKLAENTRHQPSLRPRMTPDTEFCGLTSH